MFKKDNLFICFFFSFGLHYLYNSEFHMHQIIMKQSDFLVVSERKNKHQKLVVVIECLTQWKRSLRSNAICILYIKLYA